MNRDEGQWEGGSHPNKKDIAEISSDEEFHELAGGAAGFHQRLREKVSYYEQLSSPLSRSGDGTGMCAGAEGPALMDVDAFEERLREERRLRMAESNPFLDIHLRSTPKLAKSQSNDSDLVSPFNVKLRHLETNRADESFESSSTSSASFQRTEITQRTERTVTHQHTQHYIAQLHSPSTEVFTSVRTSQSRTRNDPSQWPQEVQQNAHNTYTRTSSSSSSSSGYQRQRQELVPRELSYDAVDSGNHHQPITIRHSVANASSNPISTVVHLRHDNSDDLTTTTPDQTTERLFTTTATMKMMGSDTPNTTHTSTHHHIKVGGTDSVVPGNVTNKPQRLQQTLPLVPPSVARRSTSSLSTSHIKNVPSLSSPVGSAGSTTPATASPSASEQASLDWYQDYSAHSFQTAAAKMNFKRTNSQYDTHIRQIRG